MSASKRSALVPPDPMRCQTEKPNGVNFMTLGGVAKMERCTNVPSVIATERRPGKDGQRGSMSLCAPCQEALVKQLGPHFCDFEPIPRFEVKVEVSVLRVGVVKTQLPVLEEKFEYVVKNIVQEDAARSLGRNVFNSAKKGIKA